MKGMTYTDEEFHVVAADALNRVSYEQKFSINNMLNDNRLLRFLGTKKVDVIIKKLVKEDLLTAEDSPEGTLYRRSRSCADCYHAHEDWGYVGECSVAMKSFGVPDGILSDTSVSPPKHLVDVKAIGEKCRHWFNESDADSE